MRPRVHPRVNPREKPAKKEKTKKLVKTKAKSELSAPLKYLSIRCPICFNNMETEAVSATKCGHIFCTHCLKQALRNNPTCPTCRRKLKYQGYHALYLGNNMYDGLP